MQICLGRDATSGRRFPDKQVENARRVAPIVAGLIEVHWSDLSSTGVFDEASVLKQLANAAKASHDIRLSPRQAEVALHVLRGYSTVSIGLRLGISPQTVKVFRRQLYQKCNISSQAELFALMLPLLSDRAAI